MDIKWFNEVPPAIHAGRQSDMKDFVEELKKRPGIWALYPKTYKNGASVPYESSLTPAPRKSSTRKAGIFPKADA